MMRDWIVELSKPGFASYTTEVVNAEAYALHDSGALAFYSDGAYFAKPTFMVGPLVKMYAHGSWWSVRPSKPLPVTHPK
jgi:hypothetical protein